MHDRQDEATQIRQGFEIGPATIAEGEPVYMIAEIGVNHDGDVSVARELIHAAVDAEADAVKFQIFSPDRLVRKDAPAAEYQRRADGADSQYDMLCRLALSHDEFRELAVYAVDRGVEFLATPFSVPDLEFLASIGARAIKLASTDIVNGPLLDAAAATGLPILASTGASELDEIAAAVERLRGRNSGPFALMHCISSYPAPEWEANLAAIRSLSRTFDCPAGFSDHTESLTIGGYAAAAGARIIEKHITLDRTRRGPDHNFSLEPAALAEYIRGIRRTEILLGQGRITVSACQREVREIARGSLVAACDIQPGQTLTRSMLTVKRPGNGILGTEIDRLVGRQATKPIAVDAPLTWEALS